ncbi:uncharacterized protein [Primulina huaijiensis]|uniref:uncharacterized protein n=1 Tax=Primulina huaijiensis TaxID=1492673 RepID=UPI003CC7198C
MRGGLGLGLLMRRGRRLGWLGAKTKHLKRYVSLYNARDVHAVTFVDSVTDVVWFDLGRRVEERIERLTDELVSYTGDSFIYIYSTGDKVIPFESVKSFMEGQRRTGRKVFSFNFGPSLHVDHCRTFPEHHVLQLDYFFKECGVILVDKSQKHLNV